MDTKTSVLRDCSLDNKSQGRQSLASQKHGPESDMDSMEEYGDNDVGKRRNHEENPVNLCLVWCFWENIFYFFLIKSFFGFEFEVNFDESREVKLTLGRLLSLSFFLLAFCLCILVAFLLFIFDLSLLVLMKGGLMTLKCFCVWNYWDFEEKNCFIDVWKSKNLDEFLNFEKF